MNDIWLARFRREAIPRILAVFEPSRVILFGSRVRGTASDESDTDVIIVSSYFRGMPFLQRMPVVMKHVPFPKHVDYICYTPEEFERIKHESAVVMDALEQCEEIVLQEV